MQNSLFCLCILLFLALGCSEVATPGTDGKNGSDGAAGLPGAPGERGPQGLPGPAGAVEGTEIAVSSSVIEVGSLGTAVVLCPDDTVLLGGGCRWGKTRETSAYPLASVPALDAEGWTCEGEAGPVTVEVEAYAVCGVAP